MLDAKSVFGVVENAKTLTPVEQMSCDQILQNDVLEIGYFQNFDNKHGKLALIGGRDCWTEIKDAFNDADQFLRTKLTKLEKNGYDLHGMSLPTLSEYEDMTAQIPDYSDGMTIVTRWAWKDSQVPPGS